MFLKDCEKPVEAICLLFNFQMKLRLDQNFTGFGLAPPNSPNQVKLLKVVTEASRCWNRGCQFT